MSGPPFPWGGPFRLGARLKLALDSGCVQRHHCSVGVEIHLMKRIAALGAALALAACSTPESDEVDPDVDVVAEQEAPRAMASRYSRIEAQLEPAGIEVVNGVNAFSLDLYKASIKDNRNLFLSPASVSLAMALAYGGARGATADEIRAGFHYPSAPDALLPEAGKVLGTLDIHGEGRELKVANSLWVTAGLKLQPDYLAAVSDNLGASLNTVDFARKTDASRKAINRWVEQKTNDRIKDLLKPENVNPAMQSVLVNTVYWKGDWQQVFEKEATRPDKYMALDGSVSEVPMMVQQDDFRVAERDGVKAIEMPYEGGEMSMVILLPTDFRGLPALEASLTPEELARWTDDLTASSPRDTILWLPKIHMEARAMLADTLKGMGVRIAFTDNADFSGITGSPDLKIDAVIHQTFLDVDEKGTEAAAATAITMMLTSAMPGPPPPPPFEFKADRPFLFMLRDMRTGLILFIGRHAEPTKS